MHLDDAVRLANAYLDAEHALVRAVLSDPDDAVVAARRTVLDALALPCDAVPVGSAVAGRAPGATPEQVAASAVHLRSRVRRELFAVTQHAHPLWGELCAAYAGADSPVARGDYALRLLLADTGLGPRVVAEQDADPDSPEVEWYELTGVAVDELGPVQQANRLHPPEAPRDLRHWQQLDER